MKKRMLSSLLVLVLFLALVPTSAFASSVSMTLVQQTTGEFGDVDKEFVYYIPGTNGISATQIVEIDTSLSNVESFKREFRQCGKCLATFDSLDPDFEAKWAEHQGNPLDPNSHWWSNSESMWHICYKVTLKNGETINAKVTNTNLGVRLGVYAVREDNYSLSYLRGDKETSISQPTTLTSFAVPDVLANETIILKRTNGNENITTNETSFPDVPSNSEYLTAIEYVSKLGVMVGDDQGKFNPDNIVNRAEMATIVCRVLEQTENLSKSNVFNDVPMEHWANAYVSRASELGIVNGYGDGRFGPSDPVTCEQAVTMIVRAIGEGDKANAYGGYPDGYLLVAKEKNLLEGILVAQEQGMSRGSVAILLYNYYTSLDNPSSSEDGHTHNWATRYIDEVGHWEDGGTYTVLVYWCDCGAVFYSNDPDYHTKWDEHYRRYNDDGTPNPNGCRKACTVETREYSNDKQYVIDIPAHEEVYCSICGVVK